MALFVGEIGDPMRQLTLAIWGRGGADRRTRGGQTREVTGYGCEEFRMAPRSRKRHLSQKARYALELLAVDQRGLTETLLLTYGITRAMLANLVRAGLATAQRQRVRAGGKTMEVVRMRITEAGRRATED